MQLASKQLAIASVPVTQKHWMSEGKLGQTWDAHEVIHASRVWALAKEARAAIAETMTNFMMMKRVEM